MTADTIAVFTFKSLEHILRDGGSSSWVLDRKNARKCSYVVCMRNRHAYRPEGDEMHGSAFVVGKIADIVTTRDPEAKGRWLIQLSEYAAVNVPEAWRGWRNPVRYTTLEELGIEPGTLEFCLVPEPSPVRSEGKLEGPSAFTSPLTIEEAKSGLAATFGVSPEAIEITIRG
jgi:hypothetical protein